MRVAGVVMENEGTLLQFDWCCAYNLRNCWLMPLGILSTYKAIFVGCIGNASKVLEHVSLSLLLMIHKGFNQYVKLRPIYLY